MIRRLTTTALVVLTLGAACDRPSLGRAANPRHEEDLLVYRFPFKAETLYPVTVENIVTRGAACTVRNGGAADRIVSVLERAVPAHGTDEFLNRNVRLLILRKGKRIAAVEKNGQLRMDVGDGVLSAELTQYLADIVKTSCQ